MSDGTATELSRAAKNYWSEAGYAPGGIIREVDYAAAASGLHPLLEGIKIVDCDTHFTEPPDLFTSRAPARIRDKVPHQKIVNGITRWFVGDDDYGIVGGNVIKPDHNKLLGRLSFPTLEEGHPGAYKVKPRLQAMDDMGIYAQICYQNSGVTQAGSLMHLDDEVGVTVLQIYNDAAAERQVESGQRLFTLAHLPLWNKKELDAEARRCLDLGIKGFVLPDMPETLGIPSYDQPYWADFLELCNEHRIPINFHLNAAIDPNKMTWKSFSFEKAISVASNMFYIGNLATMGNWMVSGLLDRYPHLRIGLIESGMGWIPFGIEALEHQFDEMLADPAHAPQRRPWDYFRDNFWVTYWFEKVGPIKLLETIGVDKVLFETDFPHPTALYPGVQEHIVETLGGYSHEVRKRVLERNAAELYNLPF
ncbi:amidohydrolase [Novosphingobium indicum]|uniref:Amidohydrolase n=1 Tax=Novosphingobium indicum TaxID=462949 RepID=A0ABQ2JZR5_9SPHN|nr:amidohydrolase family protein [Novosphingobium indicum]GGN62193.1 amidohydrolase [Novosphingobium indicum]